MPGIRERREGVAWVQQIIAARISCYSGRSDGIIALSFIGRNLGVDSPVWSWVRIGKLYPCDPPIIAVGLDVRTGGGVLINTR